METPGTPPPDPRRALDGLCAEDPARDSAPGTIARIAQALSDGLKRLDGALRSHQELPPYMQARARREITGASRTVVADKDLLAEIELALQSGEERPSKFLRAYSADFLKKIAADFGFAAPLSRHGIDLEDLTCDFHPTDGFVHRLTVREASAPTTDFLADLCVRLQDKSVHDWKGFQELLRIRDGAAPPQGNLAPLWDLPPETIDKDIEHICTAFKTPAAVFMIEWLELRDPRRTFSSARPRLPGQTHPGLGIARQFGNALTALTAWGGRDMLANAPDCWHHAVLYHNRGFSYLSPSMQGYLEASERDLAPLIAKYGFAAVAWAWQLGHVRLDGRRVAWLPVQEQAFPTSSRGKGYFYSQAYLDAVQRARKGYQGRFSVDFADPNVVRDVENAMRP
ncbi:hypothetical protein DFJ74DRAFT_683196 [Hyaloraphidium curvatum]|nr:hypothetical protein DFJ74DRAFT_683196 [Hyaloraphidium curvatum]